MNASLEVRLARSEDLVEVAALKRRVERATYAGFGTYAQLEARLQARCSSAFLAQCLARGDALFVALVDETVVGLGAVTLQGTNPATAHLHSLYCATRGRGVGTALTTARLQWASARGADVVTADCLTGNDAAAAHLARLGMVEDGTRVTSPHFPFARLRRFRGHLAFALHLLVDTNGAPGAGVAA